MKRLLTLLLTFSAFSAVQLSAADWPQWRGPNRDGHSPDTGLLKTWPKEGPKLLWTFKKAGVGYSSPAIVGDTVYIAGADEAKTGEFVAALDIATGKQKWKTPIPILQEDPKFKTGWGGGPRGTPAVDGDRVYFIGAQGDIACLKTSGEIVWHKSMIKDLGGQIMSIWGFSESPLVDGDLVLCMPGYEAKGGEGAIQALDKKTGEVRWVCKEVTDKAPYSSLIATEAGGVKQYIAYTPSGLSGIRASDGKLLWHLKMGGNTTGIIPTPIIDGDMIYITNSYGVGCGAAKLTKDGDGVKAEQIYFNKNMQNHHGGVVRVGDHVYGSNGNANHRANLPFICQEVKTGKVVWKEEKNLEPSSVCFAEGSLYCYGQETGMVVKVAATPDGFKEEGRFTIPQTTEIREKEGAIWTHPVIAAGKLFLRDQDLLFCFDLTK